MYRAVANIFISYRRPDSAPSAGRISDRLGAEFGSDHVFMDVEDIAPGQDFVDAIEQRIAACQVLVAVIGPLWLSLLRARGDGAPDFVEQEIATALRRGVRVIPVLVGGAVMPAESELPESLRGLARRQAVTIRDASFGEDAGVLVRGVRGDGNTVIWAVIAAGILIALLGGGLLLWNSRSKAVVRMDGAWMARMQRGVAGRPYMVRLRFREAGGVLRGEVEYPTGGGVIEGGSVDAAGRLVFSTSHVPQFESSPVVIRFVGEIRGGEIALTSTGPDGGVATGVARKSD